ncbi:MAG: S-layer homology domain-containing protein [Oscillospiraceae bacterium]|nr:S-layer homology domain-containing protein [Oscillospiraceae bacterium]
MNKTAARILSVVLTFCFIFTVCANISMSSIDIIEPNDTIISDELVSIPDIDDAHYTDDEVIIMLSNNEQTEAMQFYSIYSDDYARINDDADISSWAKDSVINLYEACIINGGTSGFDPAGSIRKADLAILIRKFEVIRQYI